VHAYGRTRGRAPRLRRLSTGAADDLQRNTELPGAWFANGACPKNRTMAWGSNNQVFLGEDLMHTATTRTTLQIIDDEVERILREQERGRSRSSRCTARA